MVWIFCYSHGWSTYPALTWNPPEIRPYYWGDTLGGGRLTSHDTLSPIINLDSLLRCGWKKWPKHILPTGGEWWWFSMVQSKTKSPEKQIQSHGKSEKLGDGFKYFYFHPYLGKIPILINIFQRGWFNHQVENGYFLKGDDWRHPFFHGTMIWWRKWNQLRNVLIQILVRRVCCMISEFDFINTFLMG